MSCDSFKLPTNLQVIYTAVFTPYVAAFLLNEPGYNVKQQENYGDDPIVVIDLIGKLDRFVVR